MFRTARPSLLMMTRSAFANPLNLSFFNKQQPLTTQRDPTHEQMQEQIIKILEHPKLQWKETVIDQDTLERVKADSEMMKRHTNY